MGKDKMDAFAVELHEKSKVKKVIGIVSGKGGVGKSLVTSLMAVTMQRRGHRVAILDADITGPSIPKVFGLLGPAGTTEDGLLPVVSKTGIQVMSVNLLLSDVTDPVVWRGPIIAGTVKQFWSDVLWDDVDFMFVDLPPGTGDVPLTVFQSLPLDGIVVVASPQDLVHMVVEKAMKMAKSMKIPILGLVENMSYFHCPDCGSNHAIFGKSNVEAVSEEYQVPILEKIPVDPIIADLCDKGLVEMVKEDWFHDFAGVLETL